MENIIRHGEELFADGKIEEAENCFLAILNQDSENKEAYNNLGVIAYQNKDFELALERFQKSLEQDPLYKDAVINLTSLLRELNQLDIAASVLTKYTDNCPPDEEIITVIKELNDDCQKMKKDPNTDYSENKAENLRPTFQDDLKHNSHNQAPWASLWKQLRVEDVLNEPSHQEIANNITQHTLLKGKKFLEVGCGSGGTGMSVAQFGAIMTLFDKSYESLELSKKVFRHQGLDGDCVQGNMFNLPFPENSFDIVGSFGVLEHFKAHEIVHFLKEMNRISKEMVVTTVPNARCTFYLLSKWFWEKTGRWPYGYEKPEYSMAHYFQKAGLELFEEYSIGFLDSVAVLRRIPNSELLQKIALAFNQENPNVLDGSLIISFGRKKT